MTFMRYAQPQSRANKRFSDVMDEFFNDVVSTNRESFSPRMNISETDSKFLITAELPGLSKEDITIDLDNSSLTISGERTFNRQEEGKTYHRIESNYGSFSRSLQLPENIDQESIAATYENGILTISIGKSADKVKKQIEIN